MFTPTFISKTSATTSLVILLAYIAGTVAVSLYLYSHYSAAPAPTTVAIAAIISVTATLAMTSLFCVRRLYICLFNIHDELTSKWGVNYAFVLYLCSRPFFSALISLLFLFVTLNFIESVTLNPVYSNGIIYVSFIGSALISAASGQLLDHLISIGSNIRHKLT